MQGNAKGMVGMYCNCFTYVHRIYMVACQNFHQDVLCRFFKFADLLTATPRYCPLLYCLLA